MTITIPPGSRSGARSTTSTPRPAYASGSTSPTSSSRSCATAAGRSRPCSPSASRGPRLPGRRRCPPPFAPRRPRAQQRHAGRAEPDLEARRGPPGPAGPALLDSYELERRPVGIRNVEFATFASSTTSRSPPGFGVLPNAPVEHNRAVLEALFADSPDGAARRLRLREFFGIAAASSSRPRTWSWASSTRDSPAVVPDGTPAPPRDPAALEYVQVGAAGPPAPARRASPRGRDDDDPRPAGAGRLPAAGGRAGSALVRGRRASGHPRPHDRSGGGAAARRTARGTSCAATGTRAPCSCARTGTWRSARRAPFPTRWPFSAAPTTSPSAGARSLGVMSERAAPVDADAARLRRARATSRSSTGGLRIFDNVALGFAGISPVVGLYAVVLVGTVVAGPAWVWVLPVALAGQCLLLAVYAELASEFPIAGGAYQWSRRLIGGALRLVRRLGRGLRVRGGEHDDRLPRRAVGAHAARRSSRRRTRSSSTGIVLVRGLLARGRARHRRAEPGGQGRASPPRSLASVGIGLALLLVFREQDLSILTDTLGAEALSGGSRSRGAAGRARRRRLGVHRLRRRASARPRRRATPRATCRGRSGSRC